MSIITDGILEVSRPKTTDDFPDVPPGTKIRREDGNIYTVAEDGGWLYDEDGKIVDPFDLVPYPNQKVARILVLGEDLGIY